jgi:hypothetical protein
VAVPEDVGLDAVGAAFLGVGHQLGPHLRAGAEQQPELLMQTLPNV